jgi:anti-sigma B factor antagonist
MKCTRTDTETESTLKLEGALDARTVTEVRPIFEATANGPSRSIVVDLASLTMLDSSGIGLLVALSKRLRAEARDFRVQGAHDQPLMVIKLLKLETAFSLAI